MEGEYQGHAGIRRWWQRPARAFFPTSTSKLSRCIDRRRTMLATVRTGVVTAPAPEHRRHVDLDGFRMRDGKASGGSLRRQGRGPRSRGAVGSRRCRRRTWRSSSGRRAFNGGEFAWADGPRSRLSDRPARVPRGHLPRPRRREETASWDCFRPSTGFDYEVEESLDAGDRVVALATYPGARRAERRDGRADRRSLHAA